MPDDNSIKGLDAFVEAMASLYGGRLVSLYLIGESALDRPEGERRLIKTLAVMSKLGVEELRGYAAVHDKWVKKGFAAPLMITREMLGTSTDVFPIEYLEMKEANILLHGTDVLADVEVSTENLRRQCEEQVKGKLIHLRQGYMETGGDGRAVAGLIASSIGPFVSVMRNVLRLLGKDAPSGYAAVIDRFCKETALAGRPFMDALNVRQGTVKPKVDDAHRLYSAYLGEVERMADLVDKMAG